MPVPSISRRINERLQQAEDEYYRHIQDGDCLSSLDETCPGCEAAVIAGVEPQDEEPRVLEEDDY